MSRFKYGFEALVITTVLAVILLLMEVYPTVTTALYYPLRLYGTGFIRQMTVDSTSHLVIGDEESGYLDKYSIIVKEIDQPLLCYESEYHSLKHNQKVNVLYSNKIKQGIYFKGNKFSFFSFVNNLHFFTGIWILVNLSIIIYLVVNIFYHIKNTLIKIKNRTKITFESNSDWTTSLRLYVANFTPFILAVLLTYLIAIYLIKAICSVENESESVFGSYLTTAFLIILFSPNLIYAIIYNYRTTQDARVIKVRNVIISIITLWAVIKIFFKITEDMSSSKTMTDALIELLKSLLK